jgi:hypothetical protein
MLEFLTREWCVQFGAEIIITSIFSYVIISVVLNRYHRRRERLKSRHAARSNVIEDDKIQLCSNRVHIQDDGTYTLEMIVLKSERIDTLISDPALRNLFLEQLGQKKRDVEHTRRDEVYIDDLGPTSMSSLIIFNETQLQKKLSSFLYDLMAERRGELLYYFGEGAEMVMSFHYEKVFEGGTERPRIFIFELRMIREVYNQMTTQPQQFRASMKTRSSHFLQRLQVMTEVYAQHLVQEAGRARGHGLWPYDIPHSHQQVTLLGRRD